MAIETIMVVGAGIMGGGITQVCVEAGFPTVIVDVNEDVAKAGREKVAPFFSLSTQRLSTLRQRLTARDPGAPEPRIRRGRRRCSG